MERKFNELDDIDLLLRLCNVPCAFSLHVPSAHDHVPCHFMSSLNSITSRPQDADALTSRDDIALRRICLAERTLLVRKRLVLYTGMLSKHVPSEIGLPRMRVLTAIFLEFPITIVERADLTSLQPTRDAMKMECVLYINLA